MPVEFCIVGAGKVGPSLAHLLHEAGWIFVGAADHSMESAKAACQFVGEGEAASNPAEIASQAKLTLITTPDEAIEDVCGEIAENGGFDAHSIAAHCSGALSSDVLEPARARGAAVGSMHPLQSFATRQQALRLIPGSYCCVEGDPAAVGVLTDAAEAIGMESMSIPTENKSLYHAAAVMACNYLVALQDAAMELAAESGLKREVALKAFLPLIQGTVQNLKKLGLTNCLTGPIVRGDVETVRRHLEALQESRIELARLYRRLGLRTLEIARRTGRLSEDELKDLKTVLSE
ncbi:MAG: Rossmann-like and DUF2520 domain-containing protein [Candidatus Brocadiia bacterium]